MIWFCIGTSGELIKTYSLMNYCKEKNIPWFAVSTGQSGIHFRKQWEDFQLPIKNLIFINETNTDLRTSQAAARWFFSGMLKSGQNLRGTISTQTGKPIHSKEDFWVVHGDTLSSVMGVEYGKRLGIRVAHVESGMTSGSVFEPFPEEICRRWTSRRADFCFAPDDEAVNGLLSRKIRGQVTRTDGNTLMDSVKVVTQKIPAQNIPKNPYALVNIHRYENLHSTSRWNHISRILLKAADKIQLLIALHPGTEEKITSDHALMSELEKKGAMLLSRQPFTHFIHLVANARYLLSDGGSNQQESSYLGVPCLLIRDRTESREGMGKNCILSRFDDAVIDSFLSNADRYRFPVETSQLSPTERVMEALLKK